MISIIVCSIDPAKFAAATASFAAALPDTQYEIVGIHDARSLCEGYNRGIARARGEFCIFAHDDIEILVPDLDATLRRHLAGRDVVGIAGTTRLVGMGWANSGIRCARGIVTHVVGDDFDVRLFGVPPFPDEPIVALDGVFIATGRELAQRIGFDADTFDGWHGYDTDFSFRCHLAGLRLGVALDLPLVHHSDAHVDAAWLEYDRRFRTKHGARLATGEGPWLHVHRRVRTREDACAAYDLPRLRAIAAEVARRVPAHEPAEALEDLRGVIGET